MEKAAGQKTGAMKIATGTPETTLTIRSTEKVGSTGRMATITKVNTHMTCVMDTERCIGMMVPFTKAIGTREYSTAMVQSLFRTVRLKKDASKMVSILAKF